MPITLRKNCFRVVNYPGPAGSAFLRPALQEGGHVVRAAHPHDVTVRHVLSKQPFALRNPVQQLNLSWDVTVLVLQRTRCKRGACDAIALLHKMGQYFIAPGKARTQVAMGYSILYVEYLEGIGTCRDASALYVACRIGQMLEKPVIPFVPEFLLIGCHCRLGGFVPIRRSRFVMPNNGCRLV